MHAPDPNFGRLLTREESADFLQVSIRTFETLRKHEPVKLPHSYHDGRVWFDLEVLKHWAGLDSSTPLTESPPCAESESIPANTEESPLVTKES